jgi:hypothetical protein
MVPIKQSHDEGEDSPGQKAVKHGFQMPESNRRDHRRGARRSFQHRRVEDGEVGKIENFFGQLWWFPGLSCPRVSPSTNLC